MKQRMMTLLLCLCMALTLLPTVALADGGSAPAELTASTTVESGKVYTISDAIEDIKKAVGEIWQLQRRTLLNQP